MQKLIKLKLVGLGHNKEGYNLKGMMDWLDEKNDITFITIPKLIDPGIFMKITCSFLVPCVTNYEDYLKIKKHYGGLPIAINIYYSNYLRWLKSIKFYDFIDKHNIKLDINRDYWYIHPHNYKVIKKIQSKPIKKPIRKTIKIKKIKI